MLDHAIRICTAAEAASLDRAAIEAGTPGRALMGRAGAAAAAEIVREFTRELVQGALVLAGSGNNGGDGWVIARALHAAGFPVRVWESAPSATPDAAAERTLALAAGIALAPEPYREGEGVVIDALLGTGAALPVRGPVRDGVACAIAARARGAIVVAIDLPTGVDATTGAVDPDGSAVAAHLTITFGTLERGHLVARDRCGDVAVVDIGLPPVRDTALPMLVDEPLARALLPPIAGDAHKGTKKRVVLVGGAAGMAGAIVLAARGALRAGAGLVKAVVHPASLPVVQQAVPQALAAVWPDDEAGVDSLVEWADVIAIGPGLGTAAGTRTLVERLLRSARVPIVLDADALNLFAGDVSRLTELVGERETLLTPHPAEMMRLAGLASIQEVLAGRFEVGAAFASETGATVLLKGTPTVISDPHGRRLVTATGTPALATGGSGDVLTGVAATLLAQTGSAWQAGAAAAWAHGRAAEIATAQAGTDRGVPLDAILDAVPDAVLAAWSEELPRPRYPVVAFLPAAASHATLGTSA